MSIEGFEPKIETEKSPAPKVLRGMPEFLESKEGSEQEDKGPLYLMMNLETKCSYRCPKCALPGYRRDMNEPMSLEQRKKLLTKAGELGIKELVVVGAGEPTEHFDDIMKPVIESASQEGLGTIMFTTTSHMNREQAEFYRDHDVTIFVSLDAINPETYKKLTGTGNLEQVLDNIQMLKDVYGQSEEVVNGKKVVRLAINVTVVKQNKDQLDALRELAGDDMQFIANFPIRRGKFKSDKVWEELVGDEYDELQRLAQEKSSTGGHSSIDEGVCSYFNRGISVDVDGQLLSCGYASETAHSLGTVTDESTLDELKKHYTDIRTRYKQFTEKAGRTPSCPLRDEDYQGFLDELKK
ncbi:MAG: radical SAM protein [Elusimicrobiota bacterium]